MAKRHGALGSAHQMRSPRKTKKRLATKRALHASRKAR